MSDYYQATGGGGQTGTGDDVAPASSPPPIEDGKSADGSPAPEIGKSPFEEAGVGSEAPPAPADETPSGGAPTGGGSDDSATTPLDAAKAASTPQEAYNAFVDQLLLQLGFDKLEEPQKGQLVDAIKQRVEARVLRTLMTSLTEEQTKELNEEIEGKGLSEEAIINLLVEKAPNASTAILSALDDLYMEMKEETDMLWKAAAAKAANDSDSRSDQNQ